MARLGIETDTVDRAVYDRTVARFRQAGIRLPTFRQLADPGAIPADVLSRLVGVDPDAADPLNLYRVHWYNAADRRSLDDVPGHILIPPSVSGVPGPILVLLGERFPMIAAHKVLAAYGCLVPRIVTGQFDPTTHKALWPSTGNYCRGGVAISRILGCRGVAILPAGMSRERFAWLDRWCTDPSDIVRTPGTESNVREIYEECARLDREPSHVIFNQFAEFGNYLSHWLCTGRAAERVYETHRARHPALRLAAFVSATGSAGTLAAGDWLKERLGARIVAAEAAECPTMLENGFGEHNIQGIGDKHIPLIHNVMNTDLVVAVSDRATDSLNLMVSEPAGRQWLRERLGADAATLDALSRLGLSGWCNVLSAIKTARALGLGPDDAVVTVATDSNTMYQTERDRIRAREFPRGFERADAAAVWGRHMSGASTEGVLELTTAERRRVFNLGYFTWVEQQGVSFEDFTRRAHEPFWTGLRPLLDAWDERIVEMNRAAGAA